MLGFFLMVNDNLQRVVGRWSEAAEMSVYLKDDATREQVQALEALIDQGGLVDRRQFLSKADALARFREDFPDLAGATERLERNPAAGVARNAPRAGRAHVDRRRRRARRDVSGPSRASPMCATTGAG